MTKITCIGAGSYSFGLSTLITLLQSEKLDGAELALVDTNQESLDLISALANWLNSEWNSNKRITSHSNHKTALKGSDFVINAIEVQPREKLWQQDFELSQKFGIRQPYAENGGPGGFAHAARNVNSILEITHEMETLCPDALFINFTNPMHRICYLINEYTKIRVVGLCHQLAIGYAMVAKALAPVYGFTDAESFLSTHADPANELPQRHMAFLGMENFKITAAGLNHFTWMTALQDRRSGEDLYPLFHDYWSKLSKSFEPLTQKIYNSFNMFPIPGDEHLGEYLPWLSCSRTNPWLKYDLSLYDWDYYDASRDQQWLKITEDVKNKTNPNQYQAYSEGALEIIEATMTDQPLYWEAVNIPNQGAIVGLPANAIVEVPAVVNREGFHPQESFTLPTGVLSLLQREVATSQLNIDAVVHGDRQLALQSLLLDPVIDDLDQAELILEEIISTNQEFLPQFN